MAGETTITIIGNLTGDIELRSTQQGRQVGNLTIASTPRVFNRSANQWENGGTLFLRCTLWGDLASHAAQSLAKGMRVIARGRLGQRSYQAQDGTNRTVTELTVDDIGPSLTHATAQVTRIQNNGNGNGFTGSFGPATPPVGQQPAAGNTQWDQGEDPWGI